MQMHWQIGRGEEIAVCITQEIKIGQLETDQEINYALKKIFVLIGLANDRLPEEHQKAVLIDFIKRTYANLSPKELVVAFELSLSGVFEVDLNHFHTFSVKYLTSIVNSYLNHRKRVVAKLMKQQEIERIEKAEMTESEKAAINKRFDRNVILECYNQFLKLGYINFSPVPIEHFYKELEERHQLINLSDDEKLKMIPRHTKKVEIELKQKSSLKSTSKKELNYKKEIIKILNGENPKTKKQLIKDSCRLELIKNLFKQWSENFICVETKLKLK